MFGVMFFSVSWWICLVSSGLLMMILILVFYRIECGLKLNELMNILCWLKIIVLLCRLVLFDLCRC